VPLDGSGAFQFCPSLGDPCTPATARQVLSVISDLLFIRIYGDVKLGAGETVGLDNVSIAGGTGPPDGDGDGVSNYDDNCPGAANPTQADLDSDGVGDACDLNVDGDGRPNGSDSCPRLSAATPSGCPSVARTLTLTYKVRMGKFTGALTASKPQCKSAQPVTIFRQKSGPDQKLGSATTSAAGAYSLTKQVGSGKYYATVPLKMVVNLAQCNAAKSPVLTRP
jgi:hypothetical protein